MTSPYELTELFSNDLVSTLSRSSFELHLRRLRSFSTETLVSDFKNNNYVSFNSQLEVIIDNYITNDSLSSYTRKGYLSTILKLSQLGDGNRAKALYYLNKFERDGKTKIDEKYSTLSHVSLEDVVEKVALMTEKTRKQKENKLIALIYTQCPLRDDLSGSTISLSVVEGQNTFYFNERKDKLYFSLQISKTISKNHPPVLFELDESCTLLAKRLKWHTLECGSLLFAKRKLSHRVSSIFANLGFNGINFLRRLHRKKATESGNFELIRDTAVRSGHNLATSLHYDMK